MPDALVGMRLTVPWPFTSLRISLRLLFLPFIGGFHLKIVVLDSFCYHYLEGSNSSWSHMARRHPPGMVGFGGKCILAVRDRDH